MSDGRVRNRWQAVTGAKLATYSLIAFLAYASVGLITLSVGQWTGLAHPLWPAARGTPMPRISCAQDYENATKGNCYGFPWTRLGYTYDWTPGAKDDRGVTEFVVPEGSIAYLESVGTQRDAFPFRRR